MFKMRHGCFETNSSSMHSIVIMKDRKNTDEYFESFLDKDGLLKIWSTSDLNFGRAPFEVLSSFERKLCYAIASFGLKHFNECVEIAKKYAVSRYGSTDGQLRHCTGIKLPKSYYDDGKNDYYGDVDHQSMDVLFGFLRKHNLTLEQFLANPNYVVIIDGDEYCIFDTMREIGLIDERNLMK